jgi:hydrogenase 3 maturation protease
MPEQQPQQTAKPTRALLCVGNNMMADDGAGPRLAELCQQHPLPGWTVVDGGAAPENDIYYLRDLQPDELVIVDATEMGLAPGEMRTIEPQDIADMFIFNTHNMPLTFLIDQIRQAIPKITFIGIQPELVAFYYPMSPSVESAVLQLHQKLQHWQQGCDIEPYQINA